MTKFSAERISPRAREILLTVFLVILFLLFSLGVEAKVTGDCANCHTMHNTQGGVTVNGQASPMVMLLKISCLGCHAMNTAQKIETLGGNNVPQVRHTDASGDLAGGTPTCLGTRARGRRTPRGII